LTKISYIKETDSKNFIMVDGGMNVLIRPSMYDAYHHPMLVNIKNTEKFTCDIVGPICESGDVIVKDIEFEKPNGKNYIVFLSAGAYGYSMSSMYNLHGLVCEVWIDNGQIKQIRKPIKFDDLIKFEECF
jgi:diaminopimelate decarboxylase